MRALAVLFLAGAALAADVELKHDSGKLDGQRSHRGAGHVIAFQKPKGKRWIRSVVVHGARYGGGYDPAATPVFVNICDDKLRSFSTTEATYEPFKPGRFEWVEIPLEEPVEAPARFKVVVEFNPTATKGVFVGWSKVEESHSSFGSPDVRERPFDPDKEWMIRVRLAKKKPKGAAMRTKGKTADYRKDFEFLERTVRLRFPALKKKGVDWKSVCKQWRPSFLQCKDDKTHLLNVHQLLAVLGDMHTGVTDSKVSPHVPLFDGLDGAGFWIETDRGRRVVRAMAQGHALEGRVDPGAELVTIAGRPAKLVHEETRQRLRRWAGWSSTHFLDAALSCRFFPFDDKKSLKAGFLNPDGGFVEVELRRRPGVSRIRATMPEGVGASGAAVSARIDGGLGYLRILGGMNERTQREFHRAFDRLKGVKGILLDCRGMGGGGDGFARSMAGRFYPRARHPMRPSGDWQFDGPVVMLQDERQVSSAETFTWLMTETGRAHAVGRPTGGATIIPTSFEAPSGLFKFRLGVTDRRTPVRRVQPEGIGMAPDIAVPCEPYLLARDKDPVFAVGAEVLRQVVAGEAPRWAPDEEACARWEIVLCESEQNPMPDFAGAIERLGARAKPAWKREAEAQRAWEALVAEGFPPPGGKIDAFARRYAGTRYAAAVRP